MKASPDEAAAALRQGLEGLDADVSGEGTSFSAEVKRSMRKNRWAATWNVNVQPRRGGSLATVRVEMNGNKHYGLLDELADQVGEMLDDRGLDEAIDRLGKLGKTFGRKEVLRARHMLHSDEEVLQLGQGKYGDKMGIVILTDRRLFFFEKSLGAQMSRNSRSSRSLRSRFGARGGEKLTIHASGNVGEISHMGHGQGDEIARRIRSLVESRDAPASIAVAPAQPDVVDQLTRLAELRDAGIIEESEFAKKKAELLERL